MKAVVISGAQRASVTDVPLSQLAAHDVRVRVLATGICGTDVELFDGSMPYFTSGLGHYPLTPGHEWVGEVSEVGAAVDTFKMGDRVAGECSCGCMRCALCHGGYYHRCAYRTETGVLNRAGALAEFIDFPAIFLHRVSPNVPLESACLIEPSAVAFNGVRRAQISPRDDVAILGDGPIGLLLLQMAKAFGARSVTLIGANNVRLALAEKLGADCTVNVRHESPSNVLSARREGLPAVVLEATGNPAAIDEAVKITAPGGRIVLQGIFAGNKSTGLDLDRIVISEITIHGALGSPGIWPDVIRLIETGRVNPSALVTHQLTLDEYPRAIALVRDRVGVKTIVRPPD